MIDPGRIRQGSFYRFSSTNTIYSILLIQDGQVEYAIIKDGRISDTTHCKGIAVLAEWLSEEVRPNWQAIKPEPEIPEWMRGIE